MDRRSLARAGEATGFIPDKLMPLFWKQLPDGTPIRYKCAYGGRGGAKSYNFARALVAKAYSERHLVLCTREYQNTISDSVKRVIERQIQDLGLAQWFMVNESQVRSRTTGSEFLFKGLRRDIQGIRSLEGVTICWVEEAHWVTRDSWLILDPTIRMPGSEIWVTYNPNDEMEPTHQMFAVHPPPNAWVVKISWRDNPWFPAELERLRQHMLATDPDSYDWVWEGDTRKISSATIFRNHYTIETFDEPEMVQRYFYGIDWGFSNDPTAAVRFYIHEERLFVTHEFFGVGVELDDIGVAVKGGRSERTGIEYEGIPGIDEWPVKGDSSRPETIAYVRRTAGLNLSEAEKWQGSVEDGIAHLKAFRKIVIHPRCVNLAQEFRLYSYKIDPKVIDPRTNEPEVLPVIIDKHNHGIDALRYGLDGYIQHRGGMGVWKKLAGGPPLQGLPHHT